MTKEQIALAVAAAIAVGIAVVEIDGKVVEAPDETDCTWQPARAPVIPCLPDGGWDSKAPSFQDAGCLAQVCVELARVRLKGGTPISQAELDRRAAALDTKVKAAPAVPVEAAPAEVIKP